MKSININRTNMSPLFKLQNISEHPVLWLLIFKVNGAIYTKNTNLCKGELIIFQTKCGCVGVPKILNLHTQENLWVHLAIRSSMLLQGQSLFLVNGHILKHHILPFRTFLPRESTKHNGNIDIFTSFGDVRGSMHLYWTMFMAI